MDSLGTLETILDRIDDRDYSPESKTINKWEVLKGWARNLLNLDENISATSLNQEDRVKRIESIIHEIKPL